MHHPVFGINFQIHSASFTSLVSFHLLIHFSTHLCHHPRSHHPSLLHSFTPGSKPTFSTNPSHLRFLYLLDCLTITGLDRTYHAHHFVFSFIYLCLCLFSFLLHVKYTVLYGVLFLGHSVVIHCRPKSCVYLVPLMTYSVDSVEYWRNLENVG